MSNWIDAGETGGCAEPDKKGCMIAAIFFGIVVVIVFVLLPLIF